MKRTIFFALSLLTIFSVEAGRDLRNGFQQKHSKETHAQRHMPKGKTHVQLKQDTSPKSLVQKDSQTTLLTTSEQLGLAIVSFVVSQ